MRTLTLSTLTASPLLAAGCAASGPAPGPAAPKTSTPVIGMANPASKYCIDKGGTLQIRKDAAGNQAGWCTLPDGTVMEEWALFRRDHPQK